MIYSGFVILDLGFGNYSDIIAHMELTSPKNIKGLLTQYESKPSKGLGQHFLIDRHALEKISQSARDAVSTHLSRLALYVAFLASCSLLMSGRKMLS